MRMCVRCLVMCGVVAATGTLWSQETGAPAPPEVAKTVESFAGKWVLAGTDNEPGAPAPVRFQGTMECERAARGAAVTGRIAASLPGFGPIEASCIIGYDPVERVVHWMEISSTGEYHNHIGRWSHNVLKFEPLTFTVPGGQATEDLRVDFSSSKMVLHSVTTTAQGKSILDWTGTRSSTSAK